jgi:hypothetical protein
MWVGEPPWITFYDCWHARNATIADYWALNPAYAQVQSEHVFPTGWVEIAKDGIAPEQAPKRR